MSNVRILGKASRHRFYSTCRATFDLQWAPAQQPDEILRFVAYSRRIKHFAAALPSSLPYRITIRTTVGNERNGRERNWRGGLGGSG